MLIYSCRCSTEIVRILCIVQALSGQLRMTWRVCVWLCRSCMKRLKSIGESTDPCGTQFAYCHDLEDSPLYISVYQRENLRAIFLNEGECVC